MMREIIDAENKKWREVSVVTLKYLHQKKNIESKKYQFTYLTRSPDSWAVNYQCTARIDFQRNFLGRF